MNHGPTDLEVVEAFEHSLIHAGDIERAMQFAHIDITVREAASTPYRSPIVGSEGLRRLREDVNALCAFEGSAETEYYYARPGVVVGRVRRTAKLRSTGERYNFSVTEWITVRDGRVADVEVFYFDNEPLVRCARAIGLTDRGEGVGDPTEINEPVHQRMETT